MKIEVIIKPCPWCKQTPDLNMPIDNLTNCDGTWCWYIQCFKCKMKPKSPYVSLRKTTKTDPFRIGKKLEELAHMWNEGNDYKAYEKKVVDLSGIIK